MRHHVSGEIKEMQEAEFLALFDESVREPIRATAGKKEGYHGVVCFENLQMDSSNFGHRSAVVFGPDASLKEEEIEKQHLGDVPSRFQYPVAIWRKEPAPIRKEQEPASFQNRKGYEDRFFEAMQTANSRADLPPIKCDCGHDVYLLDAMTNTCEHCGQEWNGSGQALAPRHQWGEETGESFACDCPQCKGREEEPTVDLIASGYEWVCPTCEDLNVESLNRTIEITSKVTCGNGHTFRTSPDVEHAYH